MNTDEFYLDTGAGDGGHKKVQTLETNTPQLSGQAALSSHGSCYCP